VLISQNDYDRSVTYIKLYDQKKLYGERLRNYELSIESVGGYSRRMFGNRAISTVDSFYEETEEKTLFSSTIEEIRW